MTDGNRTTHSHARDVFSYEKAAHLDTMFRRILYRPDALAERYVKPGDRVLDFGCGPGFFTRAFAKGVGERGIVIAANGPISLVSSCPCFPVSGRWHGQCFSDRIICAAISPM